MNTELVVGPPTNQGVAVYPPGASYGPRSLRDHEFVWMIEGDAEYRRAGETVAAPAGSLVLCRPGATDFFQWDRHRRTRHAFFHFPLGATPGGWPPPDDWPLVRPLPPDDVVRPLFRHLLTRHNGGGDALRRLTVAHILSVFVGGDPALGRISAESWPDAVERACGFLSRALEDDPARPLSLGELADAACVTPEHLCRLFQKSLGLSPAQTVRLARLDRAAGLLARSNFSVGEISALCGFADPFHFSRAFKKAYGRSPSEVRAAVRSGASAPLPRVLGRLAHLTTDF